GQHLVRLQPGADLDFGVLVELPLPRFRGHGLQLGKLLGKLPPAVGIRSRGLLLFRQRRDDELELGFRDFFVADGEHHRIGGRRLLAPRDDRAEQEESKSHFFRIAEASEKALGSKASLEAYPTPPTIYNSGGTCLQACRGFSLCHQPFLTKR